MMAFSALPIKQLICVHMAVSHCFSSDYFQSDNCIQTAPSHSWFCWSHQSNTLCVGCIFFFFFQFWFHFTDDSVSLFFLLFVHYSPWINSCQVSVLHEGWRCFLCANFNRIILLWFFFFFLHLYKTLYNTFLHFLIKGTSCLKTCFVHEGQPFFPQQVKEITNTPWNWQFCFKKCDWFHFRFRIWLALVTDMQWWCTEHHQVSQLTLLLLATPSILFFGQYEHAAFVSSIKGVKHATRAS